MSIFRYVWSTQFHSFWCLHLQGIISRIMNSQQNLLTRMSSHRGNCARWFCLHLLGLFHPHLQCPRNYLRWVWSHRNCICSWYFPWWFWYLDFCSGIYGTNLNCLVSCGLVSETALLLGTLCLVLLLCALWLLSISPMSISVFRRQGLNEINVRACYELGAWPGNLAESRLVLRESLVKELKDLRSQRYSVNPLFSNTKVWPYYLFTSNCNTQFPFPYPHSSFPQHTQCPHHHPPSSAPTL